MKKLLSFRFFQAVCSATFAGCVLLLAGCDNANNERTYEVTMTNVTNNQVLTPMAVVFHGDDMHAWRAGETASAGLEVLAEGGNPQPWLQELDGDDTVTAAGEGPVLPGQSASVTVTVQGLNRISLASMLANTNDGFTGLDSEKVVLAPGQSMSLMARVYDAGTEANSEQAATIPGPAGGGTGFDPAREPLNIITVHRGVHGKEDGLDGSALDASHRFLNYAAKIVITRK